jgi:hypothetical protein
MDAAIMREKLLKGGWSPRFRFVWQHEDKTWRVTLHGRNFPDQFQSAASAAGFAAVQLDIPVSALLRKSPAKVSKVSQVRGISWHASKLGWVFRRGTSDSSYDLSCSKAFITEKEATEAQEVSRASLEKSPVIVTKAPYKHVHYHAAKRTWGYQVKAPGGTLAQYGYSSAEAAAKAVSVKLGQHA